MRRIKAWAIFRPESEIIPAVGAIVPGYDGTLHDKTVCAISMDLKKLRRLKKWADDYTHEKSVIRAVEIRVIAKKK